MDKNSIVGLFDEKYNKILGTDFKVLPIVCSSGLRRHLIKRKHFDVIGCLDKLDLILSNPDYIGLGDGRAIMLVKKLENNVTVVIKLNADEDKYYVATVYSISDYKLERRIIGQILRPVDKAHVQ